MDGLVNCKDLYTFQLLLSRSSRCLEGKDFSKTG